MVLIILYFELNGNNLYLSPSDKNLDIKKQDQQGNIYQKKIEIQYIYSNLFVLKFWNMNDGILKIVTY